MDKQRQDAWTKDEDTLLAEIVLRHIRQGKTQLEAFTQAANALSRTAAACGFRWNASLRKQYSSAIDLAKSTRQQQRSDIVHHSMDKNDLQSIDDTIAILEKIKSVKSNENEQPQIDITTLEQIQYLQEENQRLLADVKRYREAWGEMHHLWSWIKNSNEH